MITLAFLIQLKKHIIFLPRMLDKKEKAIPQDRFFKLYLKEII